MVPSLSVHVAATGVAMLKSIAKQGRPENVCSGRRLKPKRLGLAANPFCKPEMKVRAE